MKIMNIFTIVSLFFMWNQSWLLQTRILNFDSQTWFVSSWVISGNHHISFVDLHWQTQFINFYLWDNIDKKMTSIYLNFILSCLCHPCLGLGIATSFFIFVGIYRPFWKNSHKSSSMDFKNHIILISNSYNQF